MFAKRWLSVFLRAYGVVATLAGRSIRLLSTFTGSQDEALGEHFWIYQAIANLVKNAIEHAHTDLEVTLASDTSEEQVTLSVRNAGHPTHQGSTRAAPLDDAPRLT